jgi:hypothetical protein
MQSSYCIGVRELCETETVVGQISYKIISIFSFYAQLRNIEPNVYAHLITNTIRTVEF